MSGNRRYVPYAKKELVCDMSIRMPNIRTLALLSGYGLSSAYRWLATNRTHGTPCLPVERPGPKYTIGEEEFYVCIAIFTYSMPVSLITLSSPVH
jgi:hypothetical protein